MPITWRNIEAPDFRGVQQGMAAAGQGLQDALGNLGAIANTQRDQMIANTVKQRGLNTQAALEAITQATPTLDAWGNVNFDETVGQFGDINRADVWSAFQNRDDILRQEALDNLNLTAKQQAIDIADAQEGRAGEKHTSELATAALGRQTTRQNQNIKLTQEAERLDLKSAKDEFNTSMVDYLSKGGTIEDFRTKVMPGLMQDAEGKPTKLTKYATELETELANYDTKVSNLTTRQRAEADFITQNATEQHNIELATLDNQEQTFNAANPVAPLPTPSQEISTLGEVYNYIGKVAPEQGWWYPSWDGRGGAEGQELVNIIKKDVRDVSGDVYTELSKEGFDLPKNYTLPPEVVQAAVESMQVGDDKEMNTEQFKQVLLDFGKIHFKNQINIDKQAENRKNNAEKRANLSKSFRETIYNTPDVVRNLK